MFPQFFRIAAAVFLAASLSHASPPDAWDRLTVQAVLAAKQGKTEEAKKIGTEALALARTFPPGDGRLPRTFLLMGELLRREQDFGAAERWFRSAVDLSQGDSGTLLAALDALANFYEFAGRTKDAEAVSRRALEVVEKDSDQMEIVQRMRNLASLLRSPNRREEAAALYAKAIQIEEKRKDWDEDTLAGLLLEHGALLRDLGNFEAGENLAERALALRRRHHSLDAVLAQGVCLDLLGEIHLAAGRPEKAATCFRESLQILRRVAGEDSSDLSARLVRLAAAVAASGRRDEAATLFREAVDLAEKSFGPEAPELAPLLRSYAAFLSGGSQSGEAAGVLARAAKLESR